MSQRNLTLSGLLAGLIVITISFVTGIQGEKPSELKVLLMNLYFMVNAVCGAALMV